jgi:hypothetical protein
MLFIIYNILSGVEVGAFHARNAALQFMDSIGTKNHALAVHTEGNENDMG